MDTTKKDVGILSMIDYLEQELQTIKETHFKQVNDSERWGYILKSKTVSSPYKISIYIDKWFMTCIWDRKYHKQIDEFIPYGSDIVYPLYIPIIVKDFWNGWYAEYEWYKKPIWIEWSIATVENVWDHWEYAQYKWRRIVIRKEILIQHELFAIWFDWFAIPFWCLWNINKCDRWDPINYDDELEQATRRLLELEDLLRCAYRLI